MVCAGTHAPHPLGAPGPYRRADKMHRLDPLLLQVTLQVQIEIRCINTDKQMGSLRQKTVFELIADAHNFAVVPQHFHITADRQFFAGPPGLETPRRHLRATDTASLDAWPARLHATEQQTGEQIPRCLACDHGDRRP